MDDDRLLERLRETLMPSDVTPPPEQVAEVRRRAEEGQAGRGRQLPRGPRWWLAVAAACLVAFGIGIATGNQFGDSDRPGATTTAADEAQELMVQLAAALSAPQPDLAAVRDADERMEAALALLSPEDRDRLHPLAARLHGDALKVLGTATTTSPPTTEASGPAVEITAVVPNSDGSYRVDFEVEGFTPDPEGFQVAFNFDEGELGPFPYAGPSPWGFGADVAAIHDKVCVEVVGPQLVPVAGTSVCVPIP